MKPTLKAPVSPRLNPMKSTLKAPVSQRLKHKNDHLSSTFAFDFNLRRYTERRRQARSDERPPPRFSAELLGAELLGTHRGHLGTADTLEHRGLL
jgi:hypothetical protein